MPRRRHSRVTDQEQALDAAVRGLRDQAGAYHEQAATLEHLLARLEGKARDAAEQLEFVDGRRDEATRLARRLDAAVDTAIEQRDWARAGLLTAHRDRLAASLEQLHEAAAVAEAALAATQARMGDLRQGIAAGRQRAADLLWQASRTGDRRS